MNTINYFNNIIVIISFILNVPFIISLIIKLYNYLTQKRYIKKVLNLSKSPVQISHSTFSLKTESENANTFITIQSLQSISNIIVLLNKINQKFDLVGTTVDTRDEINIGGVLTNRRVNTYFVQYFPNFKLYVNEKYQKEHETYQIDNRMVVYSNNKFGFQIGNDFFETSSHKYDYAFLIRLTSSDFKDDNNKCVHIIFGSTALGTIKATEYLLTHCKQIYKNVENRKNKHYFMIIKINIIDGSFDYSRGLMDFTNKMFTQ